jgi:5-methylcytosine-specific restriction endonuclease McrA
MSDYIEKLQTEDWRMKREHIIERDNHQCQRCGVSNGNQLSSVFFSLTKPFFNIFDKIHIGKDQLLNVSKISFEKKGKLLWLLKTELSEIDQSGNSLYYIVVNYVNKNKIEYPFQGSVLNNNETNIFHSKSINTFFYKMTSLTKGFDSNKDFDLEGFWLVPDSDKMMFDKRLHSLQVHHKCYRKNIEIWDQHDDDYVSLCNICHRIVHETTSIPFYDKNGIDYKLRKTCDRCFGLRYFDCYRHINNGRCFKCNGHGYILDEV